MRLEPRIAGGDWAISSSGRSKLKSDTRKTGRFLMVICGVLDGELWCDCGDLNGRFLGSKIFLFSQLFFCRLGQFDGAVERGLDRRQVGGHGACPGDGDAREGLGDEEAVPGTELPGAVGMNVTGVDHGVDELGELGDAGLGYHGWASGAVGSDGTVVSSEIGALEVAETRGAVAGAGTADGEKAHVLCGAGDELAVEALADEEGKAVVAEGPYADEQAAVPEGVHGGSGDVEADSGSGFADVLVTESGSETQGDDTRDPRNDCEYEALLKGVGGCHSFSLPLRWAGVG